MKTLARIHANRGDPEASSKFDKSFEEISSSISTSKDLDPMFEVLLIEHKIELTTISDLLMRRNEFQSGVASYRKWVEVNRRLYAKQPDHLPQKMELASSLHQLGHFEEGFGDNKAMISIFEEALPLAVEIQRSIPNDPIWLRHRAELSEHLGNLYFKDDRFVEALEQFEQAFSGLEYFATQPEATSKDRATFRAMILRMLKIAERIEDIEKVDVLHRKLSAFEAVEKKLKIQRVCPNS
ncbi:MAG: tetratricopeptide repeat protein [Planctomycetaceae bacterium]|jgi:tetratricopeptide (TPR) repeat protein|nr:tetratricopeptide repeat protein [Planctomycetaceae bacterium]MCE2813527.1 tetratricopeptide repeat protein [Planctomycetaceae bacterium]